MELFRQSHNFNGVMFQLHDNLVESKTRQSLFLKGVKLKASRQNYRAIGEHLKFGEKFCEGEKRATLVGGAGRLRRQNCETTKLPFS